MNQKQKAELWGAAKIVVGVLFSILITYTAYWVRQADHNAERISDRTEKLSDRITDTSEKLTSHVNDNAEKLTNRINDTSDKLGTRVATVETNVAKVQTKVDGLEAKVDRIDKSQAGLKDGIDDIKSMIRALQPQPPKK
jgi:chaperonin cofactor prefoldin